jgi:hypothetical protein
LLFDGQYLEKVEFHLSSVVKSPQNSAMADASFQKLHAQMFQPRHVKLKKNTATFFLKKKKQKVTSDYEALL